MEKNMILCKNVKYKYENDDEKSSKFAIDDVSLRVRKGEFLAIR